MGLVEFNSLTPSPQKLDDEWIGCDQYPYLISQIFKKGKTKLFEITVTKELWKQYEIMSWSISWQNSTSVTISLDYQKCNYKSCTLT